ncbi:unnamed protein product [Dicrocoelium dendriticum]|nr:unnamed protein product [Dicrocoelium dendriticum]
MKGSMREIIRVGICVSSYRPSRRLDDDIIFDLNHDCPLRVYNVTVGQRIIVICAQRDNRMFQRIYYSKRWEFGYTCNTFDPDVRIVASCHNVVRDQEIALTICREGMKCEIPLNKGDVIFMFSSELSCIHQMFALTLERQKSRRCTSPSQVELNGPEVLDSNNGISPSRNFWRNCIHHRWRKPHLLLTADEHLVWVCVLAPKAVSQTTGRRSMEWNNSGSNNWPTPQSEAENGKGGRTAQAF